MPEIALSLAWLSPEPALVEPVLEMSSSRESLAFGAGVAAMATAALAVGYSLGRRSRDDDQSSESNLCECGASIEGFSENARAQHADSARHHRNMRLLHRGAKIVVAENWGEYRNSISHCIDSTDTVLEVGCGNGVTTSLLSQSAARVIGIDMSTALIVEAKARFPTLEWHALDARIAGPIAKLARFDAIFIDLNGSREMETLLPLIDAYEAVLRPSLIVVKSNKLKHLISKCSTVDELLTSSSSNHAGHRSTRPCRGAGPRSFQRYKSAQPRRSINFE